MTKLILQHSTKTAASFTGANGESFESDEDGFIELPGEHVEAAKSHGFGVPADKRVNRLRK